LKRDCRLLGHAENVGVSARDEFWVNIDAAETALKQLVPNNGHKVQ
jgi:hypothetical protein